MNTRERIAAYLDHEGHVDPAFTVFSAEQHRALCYAAAWIRNRLDIRWYKDWRTTNPNKEFPVMPYSPPPTTPEYELRARFFIDEGELNGLSPQLVFCLGFDFAEFKNKLETTPERFDQVVREENEKRIIHHCWGQSRQATSQPEHPGYVTMHVGPRR